MEKINQLGKNTFKVGKTYTFKVKELKTNNNNNKQLIVSYNEEEYTVEPTKKQEKNLPKKVDCIVEKIENGQVFLVQKKNKLALILSLVLLGLLAVGAIFYFNREEKLKGFEDSGVKEVTPVKQDKIKTEIIQEPNMVKMLAGETTPATDIESFNRSLKEDNQILPVAFKFEKNSFQIEEKSKELIEAFVNSCLALNKPVVFTVEGYTCDLGTDDYNLTLSQNRALSVKNILNKMDMKNNEIEIKSYGESKFKVENEIEDSRINNRKVILKCSLKTS